MKDGENENPEKIEAGIELKIENSELGWGFWLRLLPGLTNWMIGLRN